MEAGFIALLFVAVGVGVMIGMLIEKSKADRVDTQGVIYVYYGGPGDMPSLLLNQSVSIEDIASRKRVIFDVDVLR
jgi:hypothetical protein